jgi:peptide/nickel transport system substrate-binding protein
MRSRLRYLTVLLAVGLMASACPGDNKNSASSGNNQAGAGQYPRNETLYTMGTAWEPPKNWNPIIPNHAMGTVGLVYEPLFIFDPEKLQITPWLAEKELYGDPARRRAVVGRQAVHRR